MKLAIIAPPRMLQFCDESEGVQMALARKVLADQVYRDYYSARHDAGDYIIMDNGAAEEGTLNLFDLNLARSWIGTNVEMIVPDVVNEMQLTIDLAERFLKEIPRPRMVVPQGRILKEWLTCLRAQINAGPFDAIGISKYCPVPRPLLLHHLQDYYARVLFAEMPPVHLLGLNSAPFDIQKLAQDFPWVRSMDTAAPVAYGLRGQMLRNYPTCGHLGLIWSNNVVDEMDHRSIIIRQNIAWLKRWCKGQDRPLGYD